MPAIKNVNYRRFLDQGQIETLNEGHLSQALANVKGKNKEEGRAVLICLYYSGARPNEVLRIRADDLTRQGSYVVIKMKGSKNGLPRPIYLPYKLPLVKELWQFSRRAFGSQYLFYHYRSKYTRVRRGKVYVEIGDSLRYHLDKWFDGVIKGSITPYYLRHNRMSTLSESGATMEQLRMFKGSKTFESIVPYLHMSTDLAKKVGQKIK